ncbi:MAG: hypothetical protein RR238_05210 [Lachnospiraceae bacterium]
MVLSSVVSNIQSESQTELQSESHSEVQSEPQLEVQSEPQSEVQSELQSEVQSESQLEIQSESQSEVQSESQSQGNTLQEISTADKVLPKSSNSSLSSNNIESSSTGGQTVCVSPFASDSVGIALNNIYIIGVSQVFILVVISGLLCASVITRFFHAR